MASKKENAGNATPRVVQFPQQDDQQKNQPQSPQSAPIMFGALLKERRKKAQLSQKDFADMMHVTRNTVINWEADKSKPDYNLIPELCTLLNIQILRRTSIIHSSFVALSSAPYTPLTAQVKRIVVSWKTCLSMRSGSSMKSIM